MISHLNITQFDFDTPATVWDVRDKASYDACHLQGAINQPVSQIEAAHVHRLDIKQPLYVLCGGGTKAPTAAALIHQIEPNLHIIVLAGGTRAAKKHLLPVVEASLIVMLNP